jgi:hypothetical protein
MKPARPLVIALFFAHIALLLLATTRFTAFTSLVGGDPFTLNYFQYSSRSGWGFKYESPYTGAQVLTYLAAYALGFVVFADAFRRGSHIIGGLGTLLCVIGVVSFAIEGSHWLTIHNRSWIFSAPIALLVLWIFLGIRWTLDARSKTEFPN